MVSSHRPLMHFIGCLISLRPLTYRPNIDILVTGYKPVRLSACRIRFPAQGILTWLHIQRFLHPISVQCIRFAACYTIIITLISWVIHVLCRSKKNAGMFLTRTKLSNCWHCSKTVCPTPTSQEFPESKKRPHAFPLTPVTEKQGKRIKREKCLWLYFYNVTQNWTFMWNEVERPDQQRERWMSLIGSLTVLSVYIRWCCVIHYICYTLYIYIM